VDQTGYPSRIRLAGHGTTGDQEARQPKHLHGQECERELEPGRLYTGETQPRRSGLFWETDKVNLIKHVRDTTPTSGPGSEYHMSHGCSNWGTSSIPGGHRWVSSKFFFDQGYSGTGAFTMPRRPDQGDPGGSQRPGCFTPSIGRNGRGKMGFHPPRACSRASS